MKKIITTAAILGALSLSATTASAHDTVKAVFDGIYAGNTQACFICHTSTTGSNLIAYGTAYKNAGGPKTAFTTVDIAAATAAINAIDPTFGTAIASNSLPDAAPSTTNTTTTTSSSGGGCVTSSVATPLMMVLAMLSLGFFVRRKKS